jgi:hypothetical protein
MTDGLRELKESTIGSACRSLSNRQISQDAIKSIALYLNIEIKRLIRACEEVLEEKNANPNSYYKYHRYSSDVVEKAIKKLRDSN